MISATSALSKSYLVLKSMNMKHTIQEKVGSTWLVEAVEDYQDYLDAWLRTEDNEVWLRTLGRSRSTSLKTA